MKRILWLFFVGFAISFCALTTAAQAQATRTWISGVGDDANPCSRTAPCKTFAGAISKTADCGEIDVLDPGGFGAVTISKGITLDGGSGIVASILVAGTNGITISAGTDPCTAVILRNINFQGLAPGGTGQGLAGINIVSGKNVVLHNVEISGFTQQCVNMQLSNGAMNLTVINSDLQGCIGGGIVSSTTSGINRINIQNTTISRSGIGITAGNGTDANVQFSMISNNPLGGVQAQTNATGRVDLDHCTVSNNQAFGVHATSGGLIGMSNTSVIYNNGTGLLADTGGQIITWSNNWVGGNTTDGTRTSTFTPQ